MDQFPHAAQLYGFHNTFTIYKEFLYSSEVVNGACLVQGVFYNDGQDTIFQEDACVRDLADEMIRNKKAKTIRTDGFMVDHIDSDRHERRMNSLVKLYTQIFKYFGENSLQPQLCRILAMNAPMVESFCPEAFHMARKQAHVAS